MVASKNPRVKVGAPTPPPASFTPHVLTRRPLVRCTRRLAFDVWFTRAVFTLTAGVFLLNLIRFFSHP